MFVWPMQRVHICLIPYFGGLILDEILYLKTFTTRWVLCQGDLVKRGSYNRGSYKYSAFPNYKIRRTIYNYASISLAGF